MLTSAINKTISILRLVIPKKIKSELHNILVSLSFGLEFKSFSQAGEDTIIRSLLKTYPLKLNEVSYLDIGARHPTVGSNTFLFYCYGSKGVCVDADKTFISLIHKQRPRDKVLNVGIANGVEKTGTLYFMEGGGSTFDKTEAEHRLEYGTAKIIDTLEVPLFHINELIEKNFDSFPVFLSIDIEGLDLSVLKSLDFDTYPIPIICAETCIYSESHIRPKDTSIEDFLISTGYEIYADTYINTIFVNKKWLHKIK
jgi:FkbM family methyltransferase